MSSPILFVDRDGTIITEPADHQVDALDKVRFVEGVVPALLRLQREFDDEDGNVVARTDFDWHELLVGEFDGKVKYTDGGPDALFREKKREDRIRSLGYVVIRVTWADLFHAERIVRAVRDALAAAA